MNIDHFQKYCFGVLLVLMCSNISANTFVSENSPCQKISGNCRKMVCKNISEFENTFRRDDKFNTYRSSFFSLSDIFKFKNGKQLLFGGSTHKLHSQLTNYKRQKFFLNFAVNTYFSSKKDKPRNKDDLDKRFYL